MKKWEKPKLSNLEVKETSQPGCPWFRLDVAKAAKFNQNYNPDNVTQNCKWCVEINEGQLPSECKYFGEEGALCS